MRTMRSWPSTQTFGACRLQAGKASGKWWKLQRCLSIYSAERSHSWAGLGMHVPCVPECQPTTMVRDTLCCLPATSQCIFMAGDRCQDRACSRSNRRKSLCVHEQPSSSSRMHISPGPLRCLLADSDCTSPSSRKLDTRGASAEIQCNKLHPEAKVSTHGRGGAAGRACCVSITPRVRRRYLELGLAMPPILVPDLRL